MGPRRDRTTRPVPPSPEPDASRPAQQRHDSAPPGVAVDPSWVPKPGDQLPVFTGTQSHLTGALRAAAAARALAARIRATVAGGSSPPAPEEPGDAVTAGGPTGRGLSVAEAAAAGLAFRPLRRPFGRLPHGAPQRDLDSVPVAALADQPPPPERPGASARSEAEAKRRLAGTIAELERLRRAATLQGERVSTVAMSAGHNAASA